MSDLRSPLDGRTGGSATTTVTEAGLTGMITLRADLSDSGVRDAASQVAGAAFPGIRGINIMGQKGLAWMSPDELMLFMPYEAVEDSLAALDQALSGTHSLAVNVSDARARFILSGPEWRDVLARLSPSDLRGFNEGEIRRSRVAQVPAAFWRSGAEEAQIVCFRSVAGYVFDLLDGAAASGAL